MNNANEEMSGEKAWKSVVSSISLSLDSIGLNTLNIVGKTLKFPKRTTLVVIFICYSIFILIVMMVNTRRKSALLICRLTADC